MVLLTQVSLLNQPMRKNERQRPIALFIPALNGGGAQRVVVNLANALVNLTEHPIHVVLVRAEGEFLGDLCQEVHIYNLGKKRTLAAIPALAKYLRSERPVVLMSRMSYANIAATLAWIVAGRPCRLVLSEANVVHTAEGVWSQRLRQSLSIQGMRVLYPLADCVVANSEGTAKSMNAAGIALKREPVVVYNPVVTAKSSLLRTSEPLPFVLKDANARIICAIGRLTPQKGFDQLLLAFARMPHRDAELVILGEGALRKPLEEQARQLGISDRVHMPGFVDNPAQVLAKASLFVLSSRWEGFGNVLVEALAVGVPVVSTDCPGAPRALLCDGALGHLVSPDEPEALAAAIAEALTSPRATREERIARANDFAAPIIAQQYLEQAFGLSRM